MEAAKVLVLLLSVLAVASAGKVRYDGHQVVRVPLASWSQVEKIQDAGLDIWAFHPAEISGSGIALDVMINDQNRFVLHDLGLTYTVYIPDVQANLDREEREMAELAHTASVDDDEDDQWYTSYKNYTDIVAYTQKLANDYPNLVTFVPSIGKSVENRDIPALIINSKASTVNKYFHLIGGQHAREWVGPATTLYVTEQLIVGYATDASIKAILDRVAFYVVPISNPDGYTFSWNSNRLWRKNRRLNTGGSYGVDLNRNWDDGHWGGGGSSGTPTSDTYRGPSPFSEPETKALSAFVLGQPFKFNAAIDYHSYSQLILRPAGWTNTPTANETVLSTVGAGVRSAILSVHNTPYTSQRSFQLYQTDGTSTDWWYYKGSIVFSYCIELRDTGTYGFQLPASQILPTGRENFAGLKYFATYIIQNTN